MTAEDTPAALQAPTLVAPRDATIVNGREVTFVWEPVTEAETYRLQIARTARFDTLILDEEVGEETAVTVGNQLPTDGQTFFWHVLAGADGQWSSEASVESFIAATDEEAEQALQPAEKDTGPVTELARASRRTVTEAAFELEDRFEREKERGVAYEGVAASQIMGISGAIIAVILVAVAIIFGWFGQVRQETQAEAALSREYRELREMRGNEGELQEYRVVDEEAGVYQIPIDRAMDLVATEEYQQQQSQQ